MYVVICFTFVVLYSVHVDTNMSDLTPMTAVVSRGLALHKMIRSAAYMFVLSTISSCFLASSPMLLVAKATSTSKGTSSVTLRCVNSCLIA